MRGPDGGRSGRRDAALAALVALAVLVLGSIGVHRNRAVGLERRNTDNERVLGEVAADTALDLRERIFENLQAARLADPGRPLPGFVPVDPDQPTAGPPILDASARRRPEVAAILDRAATTAEGLLGPPVDLGDGPRSLVLSAVYQRDPDGRTPRTTATRRAQLLGWVVEPLDLGAVLEGHLPEGAVAAIRDGKVSSSAGGEVRSDHPEQTVQVSDRQIVVTAGLAGGVGFAGATIALAIGVVLLAAATGLAVHHAVRRQRDLRQESDDRAAQVRLIGEIAPVVQQSLELADVLPTVVVQLSDHYDLAGVSLAAGSGGSDELEMFGTGEAPDRSVRPVVQVPDHLTVGQTLALALQRGGRSVAVLRLVAGRDLDETELQSLRALTELVTAAVVNARLYASQQEALRRLRELDALKTVFLGTASHELRTPATAITGFASLLTASWDRFDEQQRRDFVDRIGANARSLSAVVQDLLDFSLLDKGTLAVNLEEVDLPAVVRSVVDRLAPMFTEHEVDFTGSEAPRVVGDVNGIERIVTNLLTNAVKFSPAGTTITVTAGPSEGGYAAEVVVADQGPGVPPEDRQRVFTRFYRGSGEAVVQTRGVGIGLSVVAEFVARLRGEVVLDDAPGGGARFTVRLPPSTPSLLAKEASHASTP